MEKTKKLEQILQKREALAGSIREYEQKCNSIIDDFREYSCSQKKLWRQVPYWALEAQWRTRTGFVDDHNRECGNDSYRVAYEESRWTIGTEVGKCIYVDLTNGEFLRRKFLSCYQFERASDSDIFPLTNSFGWFANMLDAQNLISNLKEEAQKPQRPWGAWPRKYVFKWRERIRKEYNIKKIL